MSDRPPSDPGPDRTPPPHHGEGGGGGGTPAGETAGLVGSVLAGRYRILQRLGEGAMGSVYLGEHLNFGRKDAIKVLHTSMARDPEATKRFLRGARNASAINHPNVCTVYDFSDTDDGLQFLAMEYVDGETLSDTLEREGSLATARAVRIIEQVAAALQAAHDLGIVHRDLKPGNIMLARARDGSDLVKVVDFDIAKGSREGEGSEVTRMGFVVGTPEYMSPEQLTGDPLDGRSDIYSLGLVLFRLLTGRLPLRSTTTQDLLVERLTEDPLTLRDVTEDGRFPGALQPVLDRALQRRRDDRYPTASAFGEELVAALDAPPAAHPAARGPSATLLSPGASPTPARGSSPEARVPATRVTDPGRVSAATAAPVPRDGGGPRYLAWGVGAAALIVVSLGGYMVFAGGGTGVEPAPTDDPPARPVAVNDERRDTGDSVPLDPDDRDSVGDPVDPDVNRPTDRPTREVEDPVPTAPVLPFPPSEAQSVVLRQLERLDTIQPPAILRASADTASLVLESQDVARTTRALAGFVLGQLRESLGDQSGAIAAVRRAIQLDPQNESYARYLSALEGGRP